MNIWNVRLMIFNVDFVLNKSLPGGTESLRSRALTAEVKETIGFCRKT